MMANKSYTFLQSLSVNEIEISPIFVVSLAYTEQMDLSGSTIVLQLQDSNSRIRDETKLAKYSTITLAMSDIAGTGDSHFNVTFTVLKYRIDKGVIVIDAIDSLVYELKKCARAAKFIVNKSVQDVLALLVPSMPIKCDNLGGNENTYHLNAGQPVSRLLREIARDYAAAVFVHRGTLYFKRYDQLLTTPSFTLGLNSNDADSEMIRFTRIDDDAVIARMTDYTKAFWNGNAIVSIDNEQPRRIVAAPIDERLLANHQVRVASIVDCVVVGHSDFAPSMTLGVEVIKFSADGEIDESLPSKQIIKTVTHFAQDSKYNCRLILGAITSE